MRCEGCPERPGYVRATSYNGLAMWRPCSDCDGSSVAHCCDGLTACNEPSAAGEQEKGRHDSRTTAAWGFADNSH